MNAHLYCAACKTGYKKYYTYTYKVIYIWSILFSHFQKMSHKSKTKTDGKVKDYYTKFTKQLHNKATDLVTEMFPTQEVDRKVLKYFVYDQSH